MSMSGVIRKPATAWRRCNVFSNTLGADPQEEPPADLRLRDAGAPGRVPVPHPSRPPRRRQPFRWAPHRTRWRRPDLAVAASIFFVAIGLGAGVLAKARDRYNQAACLDNLQPHAQHACGLQRQP